MEYSKDLSIIVPLLNEEESLPELLAWIRSVMNANGYEYEVLFIDDGSTDGSWAKIQELAKGDERIKGISFRRNYGKSAALYEGFAKAEGRVSSRWTRTCRTPRKRSRRCTGWSPRRVMMWSPAGNSTARTTN